MDLPHNPRLCDSIIEHIQGFIISHNDIFNGDYNKMFHATQREIFGAIAFLKDVGIIQDYRQENIGYFGYELTDRGRVLITNLASYGFVAQKRKRTKKFIYASVMAILTISTAYVTIIPFVQEKTQSKESKQKTTPKNNQSSNTTIYAPHSLESDSTGNTKPSLLQTKKEIDTDK